MIAVFVNLNSSGGSRIFVARDRKKVSGTFKKGT